MGAAVASTVATIILLAIVVGAASREVLAELAFALTFSGLAAVSYAVLIGLRVARAPAPAPVKAGRAFDLKVALVLAITVTVVLLLSTLLQDALGQAGLLAAVGVAGFADSQSAAISAATLAAAGRVDVDGRGDRRARRAFDQHREQGDGRGRAGRPPLRRSTSGRALRSCSRRPGPGTSSTA